MAGQADEGEYPSATENHVGLGCFQGLKQILVEFVEAGFQFDSLSLEGPPCAGRRRLTCQGSGVASSSLGRPSRCRAILLNSGMSSL